MVLACAKWMSAKSLKTLSVIHGGMAICDLDVAPAFERSKHHEEIGGAIALVLIIETGRVSCFHRDRHARFGNELLRGSSRQRSGRSPSRGRVRRPARLP